jgi:predicted SAM-dependent methyltransferase
MRLNIGSGGSRIDGFENVDLDEGKDARKLDYETGSIDEIYASHILEHFSFRETLEVLREWVRVLKVGGRLRIAVPDFNKIVDGYKSGKIDFNIEKVLLGAQTNSVDVHRAVFNDEKLRTLFDMVGLDKVEPWTSVMDDCASLDVSLNLQGVKKAGAGAINPANTVLHRLSDTHVVCTLPRICWTDPAFLINPICARLAMNITKSSGVFWDQKITASIKDALSRSPKYILTWDYDSVMTDKDVVCLHDIMEAHPEVDVLFPHQVKRENDEVMMTLSDSGGSLRNTIDTVELDTDVLPVNTGHFGCTFIRADVFKRIPEPWFVAQTAPDGTWGDGHIDADIFFWKKAHEAGMKMCCAPRVSIGHLELMVTWPNAQLRPHYQHLMEWERVGKPKEAI